MKLSYVPELRFLLPQWFIFAFSQFQIFFCKTAVIRPKHIGLPPIIEYLYTQINSFILSF